MAINPANDVLDIINGTLRVTNLDVKQGTSMSINTLARNDVLLFDDQKSTTTFMPTAQGGYMSSTGVTRDTTAGYLELGTTSDAGWVYWPLQLPNSWHTEFDMHVTATGGVLTFSLFNTSEPNHTNHTNNDGGYKIVFDNTNNQIVIYWEGSVHKTVSASLRSNDWQSVNINYFQGAISISLAGKVVLTHEFTQNYQETDSRYIGFSATAGTSHKIRHLRIHNSDKWLYAKTSNASDIAYVSGNVGIGSLSPTELLDVHGNVHIASDLTVDGNLTVTGTTTYVDTTNATIEDPIIELAKGNTSDTIDAGLIVTRGTSNVAIAFRGDEEELAFGYTQSGASGADVTPIANGGLDVRVYGNLFANNLTTTANVEATYLKGDGSEITQVTLDQVVGYANTTANTIQLTNSDVGLKATGNVEANYFVGNGSKLTGLVTDLQSVADNGNTSSNTIQFTNATTAFIANSNVGIGTDAPTANLHVMGYQYVNGPPTLTNSFDHSDAPLTLTHDTATSDTAINDPKPLLHLTRDGTTSQSYGARASFNLSRYENSSTHSRSRLDVALADGTYAESTVMTLRADGKVGVGVTSPAYKLDVDGDVNLSSGSTLRINGTPAVFSNWTVSGSDIYRSSGNVGIGTNNPLSTLQVGDNTTSTTGDAPGSISIAGTGATKSNGNKPGLYHRANIGLGLWSDAHMSFEVNGYNGNQTEAMRILTSGNVGIGTTGPIAALDIDGGANDDTTPALAIRGGLMTESDLYVLNSYSVNTGVGYGAKVIGVNIKNKVETDNTIQIRSNSGGVTSAGAIYLGPDDTANQGIFGVLGGTGTAGSTLAEYLTVKGDGNVGIGTNDPKSALHVTGAVNYNNQNTAGVEMGVHSSAYAAIEMTSTSGNSSWVDFKTTNTNGDYSERIRGGAGHFEFHTNTAGERMRIDSSGNVGIGTTGPSGRLDIESSSAGQTAVLPPTTQLVLSCNDANAGDPGDLGAGLTFKQRWYNSNATRTATGGIYGVKTNSNGSYGGGLAFFRGPAGGNNLTEAMRIDHSGNVGIGTTGPKSALHVTGAVNYNNQNPPGVEIGVHASSYAAIEMTGASGHQSWVDFKTTNSNSDYVDRILAGTGHMQIYTSNAERIRIDSSGNVGIGTTGPACKLHVAGGDIGFAYGQGLKVATSGGSMSAWTSGTHNLLFTTWSNNTGAGDVVKFYTPGSQSSTVRMILTGNGNVGINTETMIDNRNYGGLHLANSKGISFAASTNSNSRHWRIRTDDYSDHGSLQISVSDNNSTHPDANDEMVMTMDRNRYVGLGAGAVYPKANLQIGDYIPNNHGTNNTIPSSNMGHSAFFPTSTKIWMANRYLSTEEDYWGCAMGVLWDGPTYIQSINKKSTAVYNLLLQPTGGNVGIGTTSARSKMDVYQGGNTTFGGNSQQLSDSPGLTLSSSGGKWGFFLNQNNDLILTGKAGNSGNYVGVAGYVLKGNRDNLMNFTGQHRSFVKDIPFTQIENKEGLIVSADQNEYIKMSGGAEAGSNAITINESLPVVSLSRIANDKKCFGVISESEDPDSREERHGNWVSVSQKEDGDTRIFINSVGEGAVWVTNINGNLESGDYITTSNVAGYGMRQDSEFLANYTVAKITMDCDFEPATQPVRQIVKELSNVNYWIETTYSDVALEEYSNLTEENRRTVTTMQYSNDEGNISVAEYSNLESNVQATYSEIETVTYQKIERTESTTEQEGWTLEVREELVNVLDEHGQLQWENHPTDTEKAYKIRYLTSDGQITDESNAVHIAAFVGCTYHCG